VPEVALELDVGVGREPERPDVHDLGVEHGLRVRGDVLDERPHEVLRLAASGADEDPVAAMHLLEDRVVGRELLRVPAPQLFERWLQALGPL
jgi:hypothetical protein